jgi:hypothetical protein
MKTMFFALAVLTLLAGPARAADSWDGTWVGGFEKGGAGVQLIFAGNELIGFFWNSDYLEIRVSPSADGGVTITWQRGQAILTRDGAKTAHLLVLQRNQPDMTFALTPER